MKTKLVLALLVTFVVVVFGAVEDGWRGGRIASVTKTVDAKTLYWIVNTPITQDEITYHVLVHLGKEFVDAYYQPSSLQGEPPKEWIDGYAVSAKIVGNDLQLLAPDESEYKLRINKRRPAPPMRPLTREELARASSSVLAHRATATGTAVTTEKGDALEEEQPATGAPPRNDGPPGIVTVRSTPYLAEVYVDGSYMGYTPAKLTLAPGKHMVRMEKNGYTNWIREITVASGSEQLIDATMVGH